MQKKFKIRFNPSNKIEMGLMRRTLMVYVVIFVLWGLYRLLLRFPIIIEELFFKPIIFLLPALSMLERERREGEEVKEAFGFCRSRMILAVYFGLMIGLTYFLLVLMGSLLIEGWSSLDFSKITQARVMAMILVAAGTAVSEQVIFSGFFLQRFERVFKAEWKSAGMTTFLFLLLHFPVMFVNNRGSLTLISTETLLIILVGLGNSILMLRIRNVLAPILSYSFLVMALQVLG